MANFVPCEQEQAFLLPPDMKDWLSDDDLHLIILAAERMSMSTFQVNDRNSEEPRYHPRTMLALLVYAYATGLFSSRRIKRATHRDLGIRVVTANTQPDHNKIAAFRRQNRTAFEAMFFDIRLMAQQAGLLRVGTVSIDSTKIDAIASEIPSVRYEKAKQLLAKLADDIAQLAVQVVVCAYGAQVILATDLAATSANAPSVVKAITGMQSTVGLPEYVLVDAGYVSGPAVEDLQAHGVEPVVAVGHTQPHRPNDFRPLPPPKTPRRITASP